MWKNEEIPANLISRQDEEALFEVKQTINKVKNMIEKIPYNLEQARKHWQNGHFGVTADDHWAIGGSPETELRRNPGKTLGELWSIEKILEKLMKKN